MKLDISCNLPCELDQARQAVRTLGLLNYVSAPVLAFECLEELEPQASLEARPYVMKTKLFGLLPIGLHTMDFSYRDDPGKFSMRDNGHSKLCKTWDHRMSFQEQKQGLQYRDQAEIKAGILTPLVWLFAQYFYRHRQRRWILLAKNNCRYINKGSQ